MAENFVLCRSPKLSNSELLYDTEEMARKFSFLFHKNTRNRWLPVRSFSSALFPEFDAPITAVIPPLTTNADTFESICLGGFEVHMDKFLS